MKKYLLFFALILSISCFAQKERKILKTTAIVMYEQDGEGFWTLHKDTVVEKNYKVQKFYAYDKKNQRLYAISSWGNYMFDCSEGFHENMKKDIPILKEKAIQKLVDSYNNSLFAKAEETNKKRAQELQIERRLAEIRAREDSVKKENKIKEYNMRKVEYVRTHNKHNLPKSSPLRCLICSDYNTKDSVWAVFFKHDTLYYMGVNQGLLGYRYKQIHAAKIDFSSMGEKFQFHYEAFQDSLIQKDDYFNLETTKEWNDIRVRECADKVCQKAPYGYIDKWDWDCEYGMVTMNLRYMNLNQKTIKYIDVYFTVKNDVGDIRGSGHFQGTGPVECLSSGAWNWDYSRYYVAGDASKMSITRIILTYMNGQKVTLNNKQIVYN